VRPQASIIGAFSLVSVMTLTITLGTCTGLRQPATAHLEVGDIP
jgi:hypothetical protein